MGPYQCFHQIFQNVNHILVLLIKELIEGLEESLHTTKLFTTNSEFRMPLYNIDSNRIRDKRKFILKLNKIITDLLAAPRTVNCKVDADLIWEPAKRWIT